MSLYLDGALEGFRNLVTPNRDMEGKFAEYGGLPLIMLITGFGIGILTKDFNQAACSAGALGSVMGAMKGTGV